jgi:dedicator of cytokinesis protein 3
VLELSQLGKMAAESSNVSSTKEHSMPIFVSINEPAFSTLHQDLVENRTKEFEKSSRYVRYSWSCSTQIRTTFLERK